MDDPKVKDLLARRGDPSLAAELDSETAAQLASWFGLPSVQEVEEQGRKVEALDPEIAARRELRARAVAAVDPAFANRLDTQFADGDSLIRLPAPMRLRIETPTALTTPEAIASGTIAEPREYEIPHELRDDLAENTPQAVLRDLHRSVEEFAIRYEIGHAVDVELVDAQAVLRTMFATPPARIQPHTTFADAVSERDPMERAKREPWKDLRTPRRRVKE